MFGKEGWVAVHASSVSEILFALFTPYSMRRKEMEITLRLLSFYLYLP